MYNHYDYLIDYGNRLRLFNRNRNHNRKKISKCNRSRNRNHFIFQIKE